MVGTIFEMTIAFLFQIPIYLICPELDEYDLSNYNSSLIFGNMMSNNGQLKVYKDVKDCCNAIKEEYKTKGLIYVDWN